MVDSNANKAEGINVAATTGHMIGIVSQPSATHLEDHTVPGTLKSTGSDKTFGGLAHARKLGRSQARLGRRQHWRWEGCGRHVDFNLPRFTFRSLLVPFMEESVRVVLVHEILRVGAYKQARWRVYGMQQTQRTVTSSGNGSRQQAAIGARCSWQAISTSAYPHASNGRRQRDGVVEPERRDEDRVTRAAHGDVRRCLPRAWELVKVWRQRVEPRL